MTNRPTPEQQPERATAFSHNLSWIAMVAMAAMCALTLVWATTLNNG
ncbi:MAG TPA: hypothetical protein VK196_00075 [Magnetospirillum sp.]|nr:hypothetical protein [Magnetospirillum sp.]